MKRKKARKELIKDLFLIIIGAIIALVFVELGLIDFIVSLIGSHALASLFAGIFFTSAFTIAPAAVALSSIALKTSILTVSLWGALGALCGDLILFFIIRDRFAYDLEHSLKPSVLKHIAHSFHFGFLKWISPIIGALIIASPLPDELGLTLMGLSKTRVVVLIPVSFAMNFLGIYCLALVAQAI